MGLETFPRQPKPERSEKSESVTKSLIEFMSPESYRGMVEEVKEDLESRSKSGQEKYGVELLSFNGRDPLLDAYEEALDLCVYLNQARMEGIDVGQQLDIIVITTIQVREKIEEQLNTCPKCHTKVKVHDDAGIGSYKACPACPWTNVEKIDGSM